MKFKVIKYSDINSDNLKIILDKLSLGHIKNYSIIKKCEAKEFIDHKSKEFLFELMYPDILSWHLKVTEEIRNNSQTREMFISLSNEYNKLSISGLMILKNTENEKKICTLCIKDKYQRQGIGSIFLKEAFDFLDTDKPLITIPEESNDIFSKVFLKYGFKKTEEIIGLYRKEKKEYIYNDNFK